MIAEIFQREHFDDALAIEAFRTDSNARKFAARRFFMLAGVLLYAIYAYLDYLVAGPFAQQFIMVRLLVVVPLMLAIATSFSAGWFQGRENYAFLAYMTVMLASVLYMCLLIGEPVADFYPFGMVVIVFSMSMLLLPTLRLTITMSFTVIVAQGIVIAFSQMGREAAYTSVYFVCMCCIVLIVGMYFLENTERKQYIYKLELEKTVETLRESEQRAINLYHEAKQAERAKSEFLAVVSHELRTPMNAIIGFSEIISTEMMGEVQPPQYREYATHINKSGTQLLNIINDILDISRAEMDKITFEAKEFDLEATLDSAITSCSANAKESEIFVQRIGGQSGEFILCGDEARILQALINIIGNAIKFSPQGGTVTVEQSFTPRGELSLAIKDEGIGISPEDIEHIKQPFQQAESAFVRNNGGLGLGLAICGIVADAHDGELQVESELGEGTTVSLILPPDCVVMQGKAA